MIMELKHAVPSNKKQWRINGKQSTGTNYVYGACNISTQYNNAQMAAQTATTNAAIAVLHITTIWAAKDSN